MNILFVNSWYYPNMKGGAEQSTKLLAEGMAARGHSVSVISGDAVNSDFEATTINGVRVYRKKTHLNRSPSNLVEKIKFKLSDIENKDIKEFFDAVCSIEKPNIIHTNSLAGISVYLWKLAHSKGIPIVHTIRDYSLCSPKGIYETVDQVGVPYRFFLKYHAKKNGQYSQYVNYVTAPSNFTLNILLKDGFFASAEHDRVVNAIQMDIDKVRQMTASRRQKKEKAKTAIFVGRLISIKGIMLLISCFQKIDRSDIRLIICGEGDLQENVEKAAQEDPRIIVRGHLTQEQLKNEYLDSDFAVVPSLWDEPFGRVVIEANQYGLPVIVSNRGGIPEIMNEMRSGDIFDSESEESFAKLLESFFDNTDFDEYYNNIEQNIEKYSVTTQLNRFEDIYQKLI